MADTIVVRTYGGPNAGELELEARVLGVPPPVHLPGVFHGGSYILRKKPAERRFEAVVEYDWVPLSRAFA